MKDVIEALVSEPLVQDVAELYKLSAERFLTSSLKVLSSRLSRPMTEAEVLATCSLMKRYHLDPFAGHLYLQETFEGPTSTIRPVLKIDGWLAMLNGQEQFDGLEFQYSEEMIPNPLDAAGDPSSARQVPVWMEASIYRKDRTRPTVVREYFLEVYQGTEAWKAMGSRQLRHKSIIQCSRVAFGLGGLFDEDDISHMLGDQRVTQGSETTVQSAPSSETRDSATTFIAAEEEGDDRSSLASDAADDLLASSFGDTDEESVAEETASANADASQAGDAVAPGAKASSEAMSEGQPQDEAEPNHHDAEANPASSGDEADTESQSESSTGACANPVPELSEQEMAMAEKIIAEFDVRIREAGDQAMKDKAISLSLKWVDDRTKAGKLTESVAQYIKAAVQEMFPNKLQQAA